ncbi:MAG: T9SS C-terminal target domain-containing protein [Candidatus Kapaibacterium sp.]|nr:MAG: T9SS C-terminal target domain-containing protein [Candidatus Kapabacteria bacterium]
MDAFSSFSAPHLARRAWLRLVVTALNVFACVVFLPHLATAQIIQVTPIFPTANDSVTIIYDASKGTGGLQGVATVFAHTGVITNRSNNQWRYVAAPWRTDNPKVRMEALGNNLHRIRFQVRSFYGVPADEEILRLAFVFRNVDGSREGKDDRGGDIFYNVYPVGSFNAKLLLPETKSFFAQRGDTVNIQFMTSTRASISLTENGREIANATTFDFRGRYIVTASEGQLLLRLTAQAGTNTATDSISITVRGAVPVAALPAGIREDGITYDSDSSAVFVLFAPNVPFVYLMGDFNNWQLNTQMNRTPDGNRYWVRVGGLTPRREYGFQYLINGTIRTPDPYADKILDPFNDAQVVSEGRYPNLLAYPTGRTTGMVGVIQSGRAPYPWKVNNFRRPAKGDLVTYELLIRDFNDRRTFRAAMDSLGYLKRLGVNCIEMMPVMEFDGNQSWGYNPAFHCAVDKYYGTEADLQTFIDSAHALGIAVILDMVLNQATGSSPLYQMYPAATNPYFNAVATHPFNVFNDFNHEYVGTQIFVDQVNRWWLRRYRFDGFRFDLSKGFTQRNSGTNVGAWSARDTSRIRLLKRMADAIWRTDSSAYVILEHFADNSEETELANYGMMLWGNHVFNFNEATMGYHGNGGRNSDFSGLWYKQRGWNSPHLLGYMESHDEERLMFKNIQFGNVSGSYSTKDTSTALERMKAAAAFFFTIPGAKMIWQFGEMGFDYSINWPSGREDSRLAIKPARWDYLQDPRRRSLMQVYAELAKLKTTQAVFRSENVRLALNGEMKRINITDPTNNVTIIGNFGVTPAAIVPNFQRTGTWTDFFTNTMQMIRDTAAPIMLRPGEFRIYSTTPFPAPPSGLVTSVKEENRVQSVMQASAYPNPASEAAEIRFSLEQTSAVSIKIYDAQGREITTLLPSTRLERGSHSYVWLSSNDAVSDGVYFYRIVTESRMETGKIIVVR